MLKGVPANILILWCKECSKKQVMICNTPGEGTYTNHTTYNSKNWFHLEDTLVRKELASRIIRKFCQNVKVTLNQDRIMPSTHACKNTLATAITRMPNPKPRAVEVFIGFVDYLVIIGQKDGTTSLRSPVCEVSICSKIV